MRGVYRGWYKLVKSNWMGFEDSEINEIVQSGAKSKLIYDAASLRTEINKGLD